MADAETGSVSFDNLVIADTKPLTDLRTLTNGETVVRGQILKLGSGVKLVAFDEYDAATDAYTIAADDATADGADASVYVYTFGQFSAAAIATATGLTSVSTAIRNQLWLRGIHVKDTVSLD